MMRIAISALIQVLIFHLGAGAAEPLRVGYFDVDASPPVGSPLAYDPTIEVLSPLRCCGIVLLAAVDWIGIGNDGHRLFCEELARAAGTSAERVAVHALHQHDAPWCDFTADRLAQDEGVGDRGFDSAFAREVIQRAAKGVRGAVTQAQPVTHLGLAKGSSSRWPPIGGFWDRTAR